MVAPGRSASGNALLWGGPQEGFSNPNIDWEGYVLSPRFKAGGMFIAGVPGVLIGQTTRFAFTTTSGEIDNSTLYVETLQAPAFPEPQSDSASYAFLLDGSFHPMDRRTGVFHFAGEDSRNRRRTRRPRAERGSAAVQRLPRQRLRSGALPRLRD